MIMTDNEDTTQQTLLRKGGKRRRNYDHLFSTVLPRTANAIDSNSMLADLPNTAKEQIKSYILNRSPGSSEIYDALFWIATNYPKQLRTKELCESIESITLIGAKLNHLLASSSNTERKKNMTIYDLACGHGLVGILLAYRFPDIKVVCIDKERRSCWSTYIDAFERYGEKSKDNDTVMSNLEFREGDIMNKFTPTLSPNTSLKRVSSEGISEQKACSHLLINIMLGKILIKVESRDTNNLTAKIFHEKLVLQRGGGIRINEYRIQ